MVKQTVLIALSIVFCGPALAVNEWDIDSKHSSAIFAIKHMMVSNVRGQMGGISGTVNYDGKNVDSIAVKANLDPATINTGDPDRDKHLRNADFFDVDKYPQITFVSTGSVPILDGGFKLGGKLTMHGITKSVELSVAGPTQPIKDPRGNIKIGATGTTTINRKEFGIAYNTVLDNGGLAVGDEVQITLDLELTKRNDAATKVGNTK